MTQGEYETFSNSLTSKMIQQQVSWPHFDCVPEKTPFPEKMPVMPAKFDWRDRNAVMPVRNQAQCGSCWAFAATAALEGAIAIQNQHREYISPQVSFQTELFCHTKACKIQTKWKQL